MCRLARRSSRGPATRWRSERPQDGTCFDERRRERRGPAATHRRIKYPVATRARATSLMETFISAEGARSSPEHCQVREAFRSLTPESIGCGFRSVSSEVYCRPLLAAERSCKLKRCLSLLYRSRPHRPLAAIMPVGLAPPRGAMFGIAQKQSLESVEPAAPEGITCRSEKTPRRVLSMSRRALADSKCSSEMDFHGTQRFLLHVSAVSGSSRAREPIGFCFEDAAGQRRRRTRAT
jgi:hypothetical protein